MLEGVLKFEHIRPTHYKNNMIGKIHLPVKSPVMTHPAEFHIIVKSTKNWNTKLNRIDLAVGNGIKRAVTERETTCERTKL